MNAFLKNVLILVLNSNEIVECFQKIPFGVRQAFAGGNTSDVGGDGDR